MVYGFGYSRFGHFVVLSALHITRILLIIWKSNSRCAEVTELTFVYNFET